MKNTVIITFLLLVVCQYKALAQTYNDSIEIKNNSSFFQNGKRLTYHELNKIVSLNPETEKYRDQATLNNVASSILSLTGAALIAFQAGVLIVDGKLYPVPVIIGGGMLLASFPFAMATKKHMLRAVQIYNSGLIRSNTSKISLEFGLNSSGAGITLKF